MKTVRMQFTRQRTITETLIVDMKVDDEAGARLAKNRAERDAWARHSVYPQWAGSKDWEPAPEKKTVEVLTIVLDSLGQPVSKEGE